MNEESAPVPQVPASKIESSAPLQTPRWELQLLGRFRLSDGIRTHDRLATRAVTALLARLALYPQRDHAREELAELLWPGMAAEGARRRLRQVLSQLKHVLEPAGQGLSPAIDANRLRLRLVPGALTCDVRAFEALVRARNARAARAAYGGDLLPGFYDEWIQEERLRLAALHDGLAEGPGDADAPPAPSPLETIRPSLPPSFAQPGAAAGQRSGLPHFLTRYFAPEQPLRELREAVAVHRWVTVVGPGGSGKTRLATELGHQAEGQGFARVLFVPLVAAQSIEQVHGALGQALGIARPDPTHDNLVARLAGMPSLLVLDNVEQLVGVAAEPLARLAAALPRLHLLLTSRRAFGVDGEREFAMAALPVPGSDAGLAEVAASPAVALFVDRARAVRQGFHLGVRNHAAVAALVGTLEGMPLAIELAASRLRSHSPAELLIRLRPGGAAGSTPQLDLLSRSGIARDPRHVSMLRTIAWSWEQLTPALRELAGTMAVFGGGCSVAMLQQVHGGADVRHGLEQLLAHSLAHAAATQSAPPFPGRTDGAGEPPDEGLAPLRWQLYEPVREHAQAQLPAARAAEVRGSHRASMLRWARGLPRTPRLAEVRAEVPNIAAALHSARHDGSGDDAARLLLALHHTLEDVELPVAAAEDASAAIDGCADDALGSLGHAAVAPLLFAAGQTPEALRHAQAALRHMHADPASRAYTLYVAARLRWRSTLVHPERVLPMVDEADALAVRCGDDYLRAALLALRAWATQILDGTPQRAHALHVQALGFWEAHGNRHAVNLGRYNVAVFDFKCRRPQAALEQLDRIHAECTVRQDWRRVNVVNNARGSILCALRRWPEALAAMRSGLRLSWQSMTVYNLAYDLWNLPRALAHAREPVRALAVSAFAALFWQQHYGPLIEADRFDQRRVDRLAARQLSSRACAQARAQGALLTLAEAVALALGEA